MIFWQFKICQGGDPEKVRENQRKRFKDPTSVDKIIELDNSWRQARSLPMIFLKMLNCLVMLPISVSSFAFEKV